MPYPYCFGPFKCFLFSKEELLGDRDFVFLALFKNSWEQTAPAVGGAEIKVENLGRSRNLVSSALPGLEGRIQHRGQLPATPRARTRPSAAGSLAIGSPGPLSKLPILLHSDPTYPGASLLASSARGSPGPVESLEIPASRGGCRLLARRAEPLPAPYTSSWAFFLCCGAWTKMNLNFTSPLHPASSQRPTSFFIEDILLHKPKPLREVPPDHFASSLASRVPLLDYGYPLMPTPTLLAPHPHHPLHKGDHHHPYFLTTSGKYRVSNCGGLEKATGAAWPVASFPE